MSSKNSVVNTLVHRALMIKIGAIKQSILERRLKTITIPKTYSAQGGKETDGKISQEEVVEDEHKGVAFMPYVKGVSDKIGQCTQNSIQFE